MPINVPFGYSSTVTVISDGEITYPIVSTTDLTTEKGILVTELESNSINVLPTGVNGYVLRANTLALSGVEWAPPPTTSIPYTEYYTNAHIISVSGGVSVVLLSGLGVGSFTGTLLESTILGQSNTIVLGSLSPSSTYTLSLSLINGTSARFDVAGQSMTVVWTSVGWALTSGGATII